MNKTEKICSEIKYIVNDENFSTLSDIELHMKRMEKCLLDILESEILSSRSIQEIHETLDGKLILNQEIKENQLKFDKKEAINHNWQNKEDKKIVANLLGHIQFLQNKISMYVDMIKEIKEKDIGSDKYDNYTKDQILSGDVLYLPWWAIDYVDYIIKDNADQG